jgi:hypothetical protein
MEINKIQIGIIESALNDAKDQAITARDRANGTIAKIEAVEHIFTKLQLPNNPNPDKKEYGHTVRS